MQLDRILKKILRQIQLEVKEEFDVDLSVEALKEIVYNQRHSIKYGMERGYNILIPYIGTFLRYGEDNKYIKERDKDYKKPDRSKRKVRRINFGK